MSVDEGRWEAQRLVCAALTEKKSVYEFRAALKSFELSSDLGILQLREAARQVGKFFVVCSLTFFCP